MALVIGNENANSGMSKAIFDQLDTLLSPPLADLAEEELEKIRDSWRSLAFAISKGVIDHIIANMEIRGVQTQGNVATSVNGNTGPAAPSNHTHGVNLTGSATNVTFTQSNDGTGLVA